MLLLLMTLSLISLFWILNSENYLTNLILLITIFLTNSIILILNNAHFIGLTYIIIYVGAICILFLFIIMMLNLINLDVKINYKYALASIIILLSFIMYVVFYFDINTNHFFQMNDFHQIYTLQDVKTISLILYNVYPFWLINLGLLLIISIIGTITLVLN